MKHEYQIELYGLCQCECHLVGGKCTKCGVPIGWPALKSPLISALPPALKEGVQSSIPSDLIKCKKCGELKWKYQPCLVCTAEKGAVKPWTKWGGEVRALKVHTNHPLRELNGRKYWAKKDE